MIPHMAFWSKGVAVRKCVHCDTAGTEEECYWCGRETVPGYVYVFPVNACAPRSTADWQREDLVEYA